mgnify:CR=1 FL=1
MCDNKRLRIEDLIEGVDFFWEEKDGIRFRSFTKEYLKIIKTICCKSGCKNCPWEYKRDIINK